MADMTPDISQLLESARSLVALHERLASKTGANFNLFEVLGRTGEVKGHSAFISELLDPQGSHGQQGTFLNLFLKQISKKSECEEDSQKKYPALEDFGDLLGESRWDVTTENLAPVPGDITGRIDIVLEGGDSNVILMIENKPYAVDQDRQLERYKEYAEATHPRHYLFYLTLDGSEPTPAALGDGVRLEEVICLSYEEDILEWLDECIKASAELPPVRESIVQYRRLVRKLAGSPLTEDITMEIAKKLENRKTLEAACEIEKALRHAKADIQLHFWKALDEKLDEKLKQFTGLKRLKDWYAYNEERVKAYYTAGNRIPGKNMQYGIGFPIPSVKLGSVGTLAFMVEVHDNVYYAFELVSGTKIERTPSSEIASRLGGILSEMGQMGQGFEAEEHCLAWRKPHPPLHFRNFGKDCTELADDQALQDRVEKMAEEVREILTTFRTAWKDCAGSSG